MGPGEFQVKDTLVVPTGTTLTISPGTTLSFYRSAALIARGAVYARGTQKNPVEFRSAVGQTVNKHTWPGVAVLEAPQRSMWSFTTVRNTAGITIGAWSLTGGVTFYRSAVSINQSRILDTVTEDALNVVHSDYDLTGLHIDNTVSDALDSDFSIGTLSDSVFSQIGSAGGGDAIDVSGGKLHVHDTRISGVSDKGISAGEGSVVTASRMEITNTGTAAASKDGSSLVIGHATVVSARIVGLMAYMKKPEYGPGSISATDIAFDRVATPARAQISSSVVIDSEVITPTSLDVDALYDTVMKKGLAR